MTRVTVHSKAADRTPTFLMSLGGRDARDAHEHLAARKVVTAAGSFYAYEPFRALKLEDPALRVGLAPYNTDRRCRPAARGPPGLPVSRCGVGLHETAFRVKVRWVTPLGDETASTS